MNERAIAGVYSLAPDFGMIGLKRVNQKDMKFNLKSSLVQFPISEPQIRVPKVTKQ